MKAKPLIVIGALVLAYYLLERHVKGLSQELAGQAATPGESQAVVLPTIDIPPGTRITSRQPGSTFQNIGVGVGAGAGIAASAVGLGAGLQAGTIGLAGAIPLVGGIAAGVIAIAGIFISGHNKRVAGAKNENDALGKLMPQFRDAVEGTLQQANAGQLSPQDAVNQLEQIRQSFWSAMSQFQSGPGQATHPCTPVPGGACDVGNGYGNTKCDKSCTASCCIGCGIVEPVICNAKNVIAAGGGSFHFPAFGPNPKYTAEPGFAGFTVTYNPTSHSTGLQHALSVFGL